MRTKIFPEVLESRRKEAVRLYLAGGYTEKDLSEEFQVHVRTIEKWVHNYHEHGMRGLDAIPGTYPECALNKKQQRDLEKSLLKGSFELGFDDGFWTCPRVAELIKMKFGLDYHPDSVGRLLHRELGWSVQRPQVKAKEKDEKKIRTWLKEDWPKIIKKP
jgi:putative transposase